MSGCTDNGRVGRTGCGATWSGNSGHCVAQVAWSTHPDGQAHVTFASDEAARMCWKDDVLRDPATLPLTAALPLLEQDHRGQWRRKRPKRVGDAPNTASEGSGEGL